MVLTAKLVERGAVRYTPAGLPALDLVLEHQSTATEDGQPRQVSLQIRALAIGVITRPVQALVLGADGDYAGFLASSRNGRGLLFHVTEIAAHSLPDSPPNANPATPTPD